MARPSLPEDQRRTFRFPVLVNQTERDEIEAGAEADGTPIGEFLRDAGLKAARKAIQKAERAGE